MSPSTPTDPKLTSEIVVTAPRRTSSAGRALIQEFEDCCLVAYQDGGGVWTIGWGATGAGIGKGLKWTQGQADSRFEYDLFIREGQLNQLLGPNGREHTTQNQFDALMSFGYNCGFGMDGLRGSTLLRLHLEGNYEGAAAQFPRWNKDNGRVVKGLTRRRNREQALYLTKD